MPKEEFRDVDNTPKPLLYQTTEDMKPKSPAVMREELQELIKEAKSKIKPVDISDMELAKYSVPAEHLGITDSEGRTTLPATPAGAALLDAHGITLEVLRKIEDKKYEIDIKYEQTRDLYEKQRVVDQFLEEHQEDNRVLHGCYENKYVQGKQNKFLKYVYQNSYDLSQVRSNFFASTFSTVFSTMILGAINPMLMPLMIYDYYLLAAFSTMICRQSVHQMVLHESKYHVQLNRVNFLGFETENSSRVKIRDIKYMGEVTNTYMSFENSGLPPSINKLLALGTKHGVLTKDSMGYA